MGFHVKIYVKNYTSMEKTKEIINGFGKRHLQTKDRPFKYTDEVREFTDTLREVFYDEFKIDRNQFLIKTSVGQGAWAEVPWLVVLDKEVTNKAENGYYVALLFSADMTSVHLVVGFGWMQFEREYGIKDGRGRIKQYAKHYADRLAFDKSFSVGEIDLHSSGTLARGYELGAMISKEYHLDQVLPDSFKMDVGISMDVYKQLKEIVGSSVLNVEIEEKDNSDDDFSKAVAKETFGEITDEKMQKLIDQVKGGTQKRRQQFLNKIVRNKKFAEYIKQRNSYICELCGREPFIQKNGRPYAEADHIIPLGADTKGVDLPVNMRCLCAQCHAVVTHGSIEEIKNL